MLREFLSSSEVAKNWNPGVAIIEIGPGEYLFIAVTNMVIANPSDNIHHSTISGKNINLLISQNLSIPGTSNIESYINGISTEETWDIPPNIKFWWIKTRG